MNVEDFVAESLTQVIAGIRKAQAQTDGMNVNASMVGASSGELGGHLFNADNYGMFSRVDFDIAVTAETTGKAGAGIKVWVVGVEAGGEHKSGTASRISFSVPVRLPDGDKARQEQFDSEEAARFRRASGGEDGSPWTV